jgi:hypothetical protein
LNRSFSCALTSVTPETLGSWTKARPLFDPGGAQPVVPYLRGVFGVSAAARFRGRGRALQALDDRGLAAAVGADDHRQRRLELDGLLALGAEGPDAADGELLDAGHALCFVSLRFGAPGSRGCAPATEAQSCARRAWRGAPGCCGATGEKAQGRTKRSISCSKTRGAGLVDATVKPKLHKPDMGVASASP